MMNGLGITPNPFFYLLLVIANLAKQGVAISYFKPRCFTPTGFSMTIIVILTNAVRIAKHSLERGSRSDIQSMMVFTD